MVDPVSLIVAALAAGATASTKEVAGTAIKDAYNTLKELIKRKFAGKQAAEVALTQYEKKPDTWKTALEAEVKETGADQDQLILQAAQQLMAQIDPQGTSVGKYAPQFYGSVERVAMGDHMQIDMREIHGSEDASDKDK